jgi:hypothetical protein
MEPIPVRVLLLKLLTLIEDNPNEQPIHRQRARQLKALVNQNPSETRKGASSSQESHAMTPSRG